MRPDTPKPRVPATQAAKDAVRHAINHREPVKFVLELAESLAIESGCEHTEPLERWNSKHSARYSPCGKLHAAIATW